MDSPRVLKQIPKILDAYSYTDWPDLSADRSPLNCTHVASKAIPPLGDAEDARLAVILSAIARTVGAYSGASDILLAILLDQDESVGLVRIIWDGEKSWEELIAEVKSGVHEATKHPVSISVIQNALALTEKQYPCMAIWNPEESDLPTNDLYPTIFSYHNSHSHLQLSAHTAIIHPTVSNQIIAQVSILIEHVLHHPHLKVATTPAFPSELMSICEQGTDDAVVSAYPHLPAVNFAPDYLSLRAKDMPSETAVRWYPELSLDSPGLDFQSISYADLHRNANQVARWLLRLGLKQEDRVAVCLDRNLHFHAAMMGIMRAGGCYVPIDPELPLERKIYIAKDANATFVLTSLQIASPDMFGSITRYIEDDSVELAIAQESDDDIDCMKPDGLAYLLYTSGTTGNPKGCLLTHRGLAQAILALSSTAADVRMDDIRGGRYLAVASIAFDVHIAETIVPIALGMPLLTARRSQLLENLPIYVKRLGVTHLGIVPSLIEATLNAAQEGVEGTDIALRYIASGGEKMSDSILDKWANHPQVRLANFYGPSEVTIGCCARYMASATPRSNIGRSFANVSAYVVDADLNILCRGSVGELVVEGPLVGRGYHGRPDLTAKVFIAWPRKGCWAYRTGDLVRMMPDSTIEIVGRIDTQIKLRGVRIESEGISAIIRRAAPSTNDFTLDVTTILAKHPAIGADQLVSLFSWDPSVSISVRKSKRPHVVVPRMGLLKEIKAKCEAELPAYMRPSHFIPLSWLPLSSNGKTDAKILLDLFQKLDVNVLAKLSIGQDNKKPRSCTETEKKVFGILQNHVALPFDKPHPDTNIFECGLDSMAVIRFTTDLRSAFGTKISASDIMKAPRISDIASHLEMSKTKADFHNPSRSIDPSQTCLKEIHALYGADIVEEILPPFTVQEGVLARSADMDTLYVQHVLFACKPDTSLSQLKHSWTSVASKCQILRTVFFFGRTLAQVVLKPEVCELDWTEKEGRLLDRNTFADLFLRREASVIAQNINQNISTVPPYRLSIYSSANETFLVLSIHHALFDGIALPLIFNEVEREYLGTESTSRVMPSDILEELSAINLDNAKVFWKQYFAGFQWPHHTIAAPKSASSQRHVVPFKSPLSLIKGLATSQQVTLQALFTCAFAVVLARRIYQRRDIVFGVLRSGRLLPIDNIDDAISPLVSVVPLRVDLGSPDEALRRIQREISLMIEYEHVPLGKVQGWVRPGQPLFEILFSVSVDSSPQSDLWEIIESEPPEADYPLAVEVVLNPLDDSLLVQAAWLDQNRSETLRECLDEFESIIHAIGQNPALCIKQSLSTISEVSGSRTDTSTFEEPNATGEVDDDAIDPVVLGDLRITISDFLGINPSILTSSMSFLSMGLDSIKSVGLAKTLTNKDFPVTSTVLLQNCSLASLAMHLKSNKAKCNIELPDKLFDQDISSEVDIERLKLAEDDVVELYPTTALQTGMLSQTINSQGQLYVHAFPLRISREVEPERLKDAWKTAVRTFSILRTSFHFLTDSGLWVQAVHSVENLNWSTISLKSDDGHAEALQVFLSTIQLDDATSFGRPPFWIRLFESETGDSKQKAISLAIVMHHALYDGISVGKLIGAVETFYKDLPFECPKQFHELLPHFVVQEKEGTSFWLNKIRLYHPARLQRCHPSLPATSVTAERHVPLDFAKVKHVLGRAAVTAQCIGQAAWAKLICKYTSMPDVVFGHTVSGRSMPGAEDVIGPVLNTVPCCIRLEKGTRNIDFLRSIHKANMETLPWQQASLRAIQKALGVDRLWDSLFLFQPADKQEPTQHKLWSFDEDVTDHEVKIQYPLNVEMLHDESGFVIQCASQSDYIDQRGLIDLVDELHEFIDTIVNQPNGLVFDGLPDSSGPSACVMDRVQEDRDLAPELPSSGGSPSFIDPSVYQSILLSITKAPLALIKPATPLVALGIDSITAIQIIGKFRQAGLKLSAGDVISSQTIGDMLQKIVPLDNSPSYLGAQTHAEVPLNEKAAICAQFGQNVDNIETVSIASSGMKWLIGAWQRSSGTRFQHVFAYQLPEDIDVSRMKTAWSSLVQRHPILRSTFACPPSSKEPRIVTFKTISESWSEEYVADDAIFGCTLSKMKSLVSNPPSTSSPLTRAVLFGSSRHSYLILHLHHFQYDAWSLQLLIHELSSLYKGLKISPVSNNMNSFLSYYASNVQHLALQQEYWQSSFPLNYEPKLFPAMNSNAGTVRPAERLLLTNPACIPKASTYEERARFLGLSLNAVFLASWARVQGEISAGSSSTFGLWHSGRTGGLDDISNLAIPCMNVLPMHVSALSEKNTLQLAKSIQQDLKRRTSIVEQSDLVRVGDWVGAGCNPLSNIFVNIIKVAPDVGTQDAILKPVNAPYFVPDHVIPEQNPTIGNLSITQLIRDDIFIDIAVIGETDSVLMSVDAAAYMMDGKQAEALMSRWASEVQKVLEVY